MLISELLRHPNSNDKTLTTVTGVVRANYNQPFPHFTIEDESGTLICKPKHCLPEPGMHIELTGTLTTLTPANCTIQITFLTEEHRADVPHANKTCDLPGCHFATSLAA